MGTTTTKKEPSAPGVKPVQTVIDQLEDLRTAVQMYDDVFSNWEKTFVKDNLERAGKFKETTKFSVNQENQVQKMHDKIPN